MWSSLHFVAIMLQITHVLRTPSLRPFRKVQLYVKLKFLKKKESVIWCLVRHDSITWYFAKHKCKNIRSKFPAILVLMWRYQTGHDMKAWSKQKGSDFFVYPYLFYFLKQTNLDFLSTYKHIHTKPRQYIYILII